MPSFAFEADGVCHNPLWWRQMACLPLILNGIWEIFLISCLNLILGVYIFVLAFPTFRFWLVCLWILISQWALWMALESLFWISRPKMPQEMLDKRPMLLHSSLVHNPQTSVNHDLIGCSNMASSDVTSLHTWQQCTALSNVLPILLEILCLAGR